MIAVTFHINQREFFYKQCCNMKIKITSVHITLRQNIALGKHSIRMVSVYSQRKEKGCFYVALQFYN